MSSKKLVKNTGFLYARMLIMMCIAFFTSRILLQELGINDFGIYNIVGGIVAMFSSLRGAFASSIQRFLNYEMGMNRNEELKKIFSMSVTIHIIICIIFLVLAETIGYWFLNNKLNIAPERMDAAYWVFQFSILATLVTIMTIPYDAVIIANEKMNIFAYISILDVLLKLVIIFLLSWLDVDKLKLYAVLVFLVSFIIRSINSIYCKKTFPECKYSLFWDFKMFKRLGSFAGWNFFGNTAFTLVNEGLNILLNLFGGTVANAARGIAYQVRNATTSFINNIQLAANPQIIKLHAQNKKEEVFNILFITSKMSFYVILIICLPIILYVEPFLKLWLGIVPQYSASFIQLILLFLFLRVFHGALDSLFKATGKIKKYQIIDGSILFLTIPISYLLLRQGMPLSTAFVVMIVVEVINLFAILRIAKNIGHLNILTYSKRVLMPCLSTFLVSGILSYLISYNFEYNNFFILLLYIGCSVLVCFISIWILGLTKIEKIYIKNFIRNNKKVSNL